MLRLVFLVQFLKPESEGLLGTVDIDHPLFGNDLQVEILLLLLDPARLAPKGQQRGFHFFAKPVLAAFCQRAVQIGFLFNLVDKLVLIIFHRQSSFLHKIRKIMYFCIIEYPNTMKFFLDTANVDDIRKANAMGVICGVTTNPSLIAKEGRDFKQVVAEIASIVDGPISGEVKATTTDAAGMIAEGREIAAIHKNMVVKIPMTIEGLKACHALAAEGIKVNMTLIFTANQALLAARSGAAFVSPFVGRLDDISERGTDLIAEVAQIFNTHGIQTEIIAASIRHPMHVTECALAGADIATVPYKVIEQMTKHPLTDQGIEKFRKDYEAVFGK